MEYTREVTLDFSLHEVVPFVRVKQWDASTRSILVYLKKDGETYIPESGITIMFRCEKPDKRGVMLDSQFVDEELQRTLVVDNRDGTVTIELVDQCTVVPGKCYCDLCFIKDDEIISTLPFVLDVRPSPDIAKRATSTDDFRTLANAIAGGIPSVEITEIPGGHRMTVTGKDGAQSFDVMDGDGYSPTVSTSTITGGHRISIQDKNGTKTFDVMNGTDGTDGSDGSDGYSPSISTSTITGGHRVSIQDKSGAKTVDIMDGEDGFSPTVTTSSISGGNRISIRDKTGTKSFDVLNGTNGADGTSPTITVSDITGGHRVSATDKSGTETFDVMDGVDGISPTITTTEITGGHRLSIQDKTGSRSVDILDGEKGDKGDGFTIKKTVANVSDLPSTEAQGAYYNVGTEAPYRTYMFEVGTGWIDQGTIQGPVGYGVAPGGSTGQVLKKASADDYDTEWADESGASMFITFTQVGSSSSYTADKTFAEVYAAYQSGIPIFATITFYGGIYSLKGASSTHIILNYVEVNYVGNGTTEKIITFNSDESATTSTRAAVIKQIPKLVKLHLSCDNNYEYQDNPSGTFAIENAGVTLFDAYMLASMTFQESGDTDSHGMDRISLVYGSHDPVDNYSVFHAEHYNLIDVYATADEYNEEDELIPRECRLTFRVLSMRNSEPILKTVVITGPVYSQDDISMSSTVTYSEISLGIPQNANGVSF